MVKGDKVITRDQFAAALGPIVQGIIDARHQQEPAHFLSSLIMGASFEGWLSFETRFALERSRSRLGLEEPRYWIGNEGEKVDLGIIEYDDDRHTGEDRWLAAVEFKVIYNNKDWESQVRGILADLFPAPHGRAGKANVVGPERQLAVVAVVHANVADNKYQRQSDRVPVDHWKPRVWDALKVGSEVVELWSSPQPLLAPHPYLARGDRAQLTLHVLAPKLEPQR